MPQVKATKKIYQAIQPVNDHIRNEVHEKHALFAIEDEAAIKSLVDIDQCFEKYKPNEKFEVDIDVANSLVDRGLVEIVPEKADKAHAQTPAAESK
jgi:hypothetical protein